MAPRLEFYDRRPAPADFLAEVLEGLSGPQKRLPPKFFYDSRGSELFEAICATPEYYPARAEAGILRRYAPEIAAVAGHGGVLIEPGAGNLGKVRLLLECLRPAAYLPMDISGDHLGVAARGLAAEYPWLSVQAICMDYSRGLDRLDGLGGADLGEGGKKIVFFPGSTIGNFEPSKAARFLWQAARLAGPGGGLLIGVDLKKDPDRLHRAYNDAGGVTREFNLNLLFRINAELKADFDPERYYHYAFYHARKGRIEMHLVSRGAQEVRLASRRLKFADGESIHTENSYKYTVGEFEALARGAGFRAVKCWTDAESLFSVQYFEAVGQSVALE